MATTPAASGTAPNSPVTRRSAWAVLDTQRGYCSINIEEISKAEYRDYMELLKQEGYSVIAQHFDFSVGLAYNMNIKVTTPPEQLP